jgi:hypothetical protein
MTVTGTGVLSALRDVAKQVIGLAAAEVDRDGTFPERGVRAPAQVCGGRGSTPSLPVERHLRDARAGAVMAPTNGVLRTWLGKRLGIPVP